MTKAQIKRKLDELAPEFMKQTATTTRALQKLELSPFYRKFTAERDKLNKINVQIQFYQEQLRDKVLKSP
jgi:hypothetical protein